MIKPEELRIGNYLTFEGEQLPILAIDGEREFTNTKTNETIKCSITIGQYDDDGFMWTTNGRWLKYFEPIPLSDEWLWALGAERNYETYIYDRFKLIWKEAYKYWYVVDKESLTYLTKVEFVHEWQNFVYAMNSIELELREKIKEKASTP